MAFTTAERLAALTAGDTQIQEQKKRVADFKASQAALGPALTGDAAAQQRQINERRQFAPISSTEAATAGITNLSGSATPPATAPATAISTKTGGPVSQDQRDQVAFFDDLIKRRGSARDLESQLQAFGDQRFDVFSSIPSAERTGASFESALQNLPGGPPADPLEGVTRSTFEDLRDRIAGVGVFGGRPVQSPGSPTGPGFSGGGGGFGAGGGVGGGVGGGGGGGGGRFIGQLFGGAAGARNPAVRRSLQDFFRGREQLIDQAVGGLERSGVRAVDTLQQKVPEFAAAAEVAEGAFGADIGDDFSQALREAASVRGLDPSSLGDIGSGFNAGLAANAFLGSAAQLATQTGFEQLLQAGFAPPQSLNFGTIGSLNMQEAELSAQISASIAQSQTAQALFSQQLSGIFSGR